MTHLYKLTDDQVALIKSLTIDGDLRAALNRKLDFSSATVFFSERQEAEEPELSKYASVADQMRCVEDGVCEIDGSGIVSKGEDAGAYVMAWVWVGDEDLDPEDDEDDEDDEDA